MQFDSVSGLFVYRYKELEAVNGIRAVGIMAPRHFAFPVTMVETAEVRFPFISGAAQRGDSATPK